MTLFLVQYQAGSKALYFTATEHYRHYIKEGQTNWTTGYPLQCMYTAPLNTRLLVRKR